MVNGLHFYSASLYFTDHSQQQHMTQQTQYLGQGHFDMQTAGPGIEPQTFWAPTVMAEINPRHKG